MPGSTRSVHASVLLVAVVLAVAGVAAAIPPQRALVAERVDTGERIVVAPVENGTTVALEYTHSVEKSRVHDEYTVRGDELEMTRMEFESYGWGLPADANVTRENGTLAYDPPGRVEELTVNPGYIADHTLVAGDRRYNLTARAEGTAVRLHIERRSRLDRVRDTLT